MHDDASRGWGGFLCTNYMPIYNQVCDTENEFTAWIPVIMAIRSTHRGVSIWLHLVGTSRIYGEKSNKKKKRYIKHKYPLTMWNNYKLPPIYSFIWKTCKNICHFWTMKTNSNLHSLRIDRRIEWREYSLMQNTPIYGELLHWAPELCHVLFHLLAFITEWYANPLRVHLYRVRCCLSSRSRLR